MAERNIWTENLSRAIEANNLADFLERQKNTDWDARLDRAEREMDALGMLDHLRPLHQRTTVSTILATAFPEYAPDAD